MNKRLWSCASVALGVGTAPVDAGQTEYRVAEQVEVGRAFAGTSLPATLRTHDSIQYVAYYDENQQVTLAQRHLGETEWVSRKLPLNANWNNHVGIKGLIVDREGLLHLSGNMHARPLVYWRTTVPYNCPTLAERGIHHIDTLEPINRMVGTQENRVTYERFRVLPDGRLIFHYRHGGSGRGQEIYNVYEPETRTWRRFLDQPLISGGGRSNAYMRGPTVGPDGWHHLIWMWRNTPAVETNHSLSHARSRDLLQWETITGEALPLPITPDDIGTIIDPVPVNGGLHNSNHHFCFDRQGRVVVTYYKHDQDGDTQAYAARFEDGQWVIRQVSDWEGHHVFRGHGAGPATFGTSLSLSPPRQHGDDRLALPYRHWKAGDGLLLIDEETLTTVGTAPPRPPRFPPELQHPTSNFTHEDGSRMRVRWAEDRGGGSEDGRYVLRWEGLGTNRDRPRPGEVPPPSTLMLYRLVEVDKDTANL